MSGQDQDYALPLAVAFFVSALALVFLCVLIAMALSKVPGF